MKKEDLKVSIDNGALRIEGERKQEKEEKGKKFHRVERTYGSFLRTFSLPDNVEEGKVEAELKDGMLTSACARRRRRSRRRSTSRSAE